MPYTTKVTPPLFHGETVSEYDQPPGSGSVKKPRPVQKAGSYG